MPLKDQVANLELSQLLEVIRGEVENLDRYYDDCEDGMTKEDDYSVGNWLKKQDVLDLLTIKDK